MDSGVLKSEIIHLSQIDDIQLYCVVIKGIAFYNVSGQYWCGVTNPANAVVKYIELIVNKRSINLREDNWRDFLNRRAKIYRSVTKQVYRDVRKHGFL